MKKIAISVMILVSIFFVACNKSADVSEPNKGLESIDIPDGFQFNTTTDIDIAIKVNSDGTEKYKRIKFFVFSGDPDVSGILLSTGGVNEQGIFQTVLSLPTTRDSLYISSNVVGISLGMVKLQGNSFSYEFDLNSPALKRSTSRSQSDFTDIISDFENGLDGWQPYRDNSIFSSDAANTPLSHGPGGSNDRFIWGFDTQGGVRAWLAPAKFSGDLYGQYIAYQYYLGNTVAAAATQAGIADIRITDGNNVLAIDLSATFQHEVNAGWQTIYCKLDETETAGSAWRIGNMSIWTTSAGNLTTPATVASPAQIQQILHNVTGILLGPERQVGYFSANGPEFIALGKVGIVSEVVSFPIIQQGEEISDDDGDGVPNSTDDYPADPDKAYNNYSPGKDVYATLAYEDLWPGKGDYDFNDVVIDYNFNVVTNASNKVVGMNSNFILKATGAGFLNGFAFELPVNPTTVTAVTGQDLNDNVFSLNDNGTEANQTNAVIVVFDDAHNLFDLDGFVNTVSEMPYYEPVNLQIVVSFDGSFSMADLGTAPYNPFIIANQLRVYEIHLSGHANTSLADEALFSTQQDDTNPTNGKYYQTVNNLPWAIHIPVSFEYPIETVSIENAHLKFVEWAESGGTSYPDWYLNNISYRNSALIYTHN